MGLTSAFAGGAKYLLYLPRLLVSGPEELRSSRATTLEGSVLFADVSGFTALSEQLAEEGKVGAERVTEIINGAFTELLTVSRLEGGDLISFGGDATLLLFTGPDHERRAATAAFEMRDALSDFARADSPVPLSVTQGLASGELIAVVAGTDFKQVLLIGDLVDEMIELETAAQSDEIRISASVAKGLGLGSTDGSDGVILEKAPDPADFDEPDNDTGDLPDLAPFIPREIRDELLLSGAQGEHRQAVVGFIRATGVGSLLEEGGPDLALEGLDRLIDTVDFAAMDHDIAFLATDVSKDGVKLILTAGVPRAVSDPEERMLRALRRIVETPAALRLHVGAASGSVFSGDLGASFRRGYTVMGDTVNVAARLAGEAASSQVLTTRRLFDNCRTTFELEELPPVQLKGKSQPLHPLAVGPILSTASEEPLTAGPLVGRDDERAIVENAVSDLPHGRGRVIEIRGEVGIGKSRLLIEPTHSTSPATTQTIECEEYEAATPYWAAGLLLRRLTGTIEVQSASELGTVLRSLVSENVPEILPWLPLLGTPIGARVDMTEEVQALGEEFRQSKLFEVVGRFLGSLMEEPTVVAFDNTQWMDAASSELLHDVMLRHADRPWVWAIAHRNEVSQLPETLGATEIELDPLSEDASRELIRSLRPDMPKARLDELVSRAGGNPLFLTELTTSPPDVEIPDTVERLLAANIDALGPRERRLLREASVLGQQFELDLLVESLGSETPGVDDPTVWEQLEEFLHLGATGKVRFVQPLIRDVAYEGLPFRRRKELHSLVGETIERRARHRANRHAAVLSLHFLKAERFDKAWKYARVGAERAAERYANQEAIILFERALEAAEHESSVSDDQKASVAEQLGDAAELTADYEHARRAYELAESLTAGPEVADLARKKALLHEKAGEYVEAVRLLESALAHERLTGDSKAQAMAAMAGVRYRQGNYQASADWSQRALDLVSDTGSPTEAHARYLLSLNQTHFGDPDRVENAQVALGIYEAVGDWVGAGKVLNNLGIDAYYDGRWDEAIDLYTRSRQASEKAGDLHMMAMQDNNLAEIYSDQGQLDKAQELFQQTDSIWRPARFAAGIALVTSNLGRLHVRRGQVEEAIPLLEQALQRFREIGAEAYVAETRMRIVEAELYGDAEQALQSLDELMGDLGDGGAARTLAAGLSRLRGHALACVGETEGARKAFEASLDRAVEDDLRYEAGLAGVALGTLGDDERGAEARNTLKELGASEAVILPLPSSKR